MSGAQYSLADFGWMIDVPERTRAYAAALEMYVTPGCRVIDIGAGPGIFAILACKFGAGSVTAIDPDPSIGLLDQLAAANGCAGKIEIFRGMSSDFHGPPADLIVSDIRGILPFFQQMVPTMVDARERLLAPGGKMIPARDTIRVGIVSSKDDYRIFERPWTSNDLGLDLSAGRRHVVNSYRRVNLPADALLGDPADFFDFDYRTISDPNLDQEFDLVIGRSGTAHGMALWIEAEVAPGIGFSSAPGQPRQVYGQTFFPFEHPVEVDRGDRVRGAIAARFLDGRYVWSWRSKFDRHARGEGPEFRQSTFLGEIFDPRALETYESSAVPHRSEVHEAASACLILLDGKRANGEIASALRRDYPSCFPSQTAALDFVVRVGAMKI